MKCHRFRDRLDEYLDKEPGLEQQNVMEEHLRNCDQCRQFLEQRRNLFSIIEESSDRTDTDEIADAVMTQIRDLPALMPPNPLHKPLLIAVTASLLLSIVLVLIGYQSFPRSINPVDLIRLTAGLVNLPEGMQSSLNELLAFLNVGWILFRTLTHVVIQISLFLLVRIPLTVPFFVFMLSGILLFVWRYRRQRKNSLIVSMWI
jgi:hypothetical protein